MREYLKNQIYQRLGLHQEYLAKMSVKELQGRARLRKSSDTQAPLIKAVPPTSAEQADKEISNFQSLAPKKPAPKPTSVGQANKEMSNFQSIASDPTAMPGNVRPKLPHASRSINKKAPPDFPEAEMHRLKSQYPGEPEKAFATAWMIHNKKKSKHQKGEFTPSVLKPGPGKSAAGIRGASPNSVKTPTQPTKVAIRSKLGKDEFIDPKHAADKDKREVSVGTSGVLPGDKKPRVVAKEPKVTKG